MAKRISLREFQEGVAARLRGVANAAPVSSRLGLQVGGKSWLVPLSDVSEVVPVPVLTPVPLTHPWFAGVANIRGNLYSVVDFSTFMGADSTPSNMDTRLLLIHPRFMTNAGLVVNRMLGLKNPQHFQKLPSAASDVPWVADEYRDQEGNAWYELDMRELVRNPDFLQVGL